MNSRKFKTIIRIAGQDLESAEMSSEEKSAINDYVDSIDEVIELTAQRERLTEIELGQVCLVFEGTGFKDLELRFQGCQRLGEAVTLRRP